MINRFVKMFHVFVLCCLIGLIGIYIGNGYANKQIEIEEQKEEHISLIAVVNLDEGIGSDDTKRYYATDLITFPNDNFILASLEEARNGILNGTFGAYIIIPATFSESVESLNVTPIKSIISYSINPNISDETRIVVEADIDTFWRNISERLSYTYVTSIMTEFHDVQDQSQIILNNDIEDMNNIVAINAEELTQNIEFSEMEMVESELQYIDLADEIEQNSQYVQSIIDIYTEAQKTGEEQIGELSAGAENIQNSKEELDKEIEDLNLLEDEEGNLIIQEELDILEEELLLTQESRERCKEDIIWLIKTNLYNQENRNQTYINNQITEFKQIEQDRFDLWYAELKEAVGEDGISWPEKFECMPDVEIELALNRQREQHDVDEEVPDIEDPTLTEEERKELEISSFAINERLAEKVDSIVWGTDDVVKIIREKIEPEIILMLKESCEFFKEKIQQVNNGITEYLALLLKYNPLENLDQESLSENIQGLNKNTYSMQSAINENISKNMEYVSEVYATTNENVNSLKNDIVTANNKTISNVNSVIAELKTNRKSINEYNEDILSDFVNKLPYTRLGDIENQQVYSYLVAPLDFEEIVIQRTVNEQIEDNFELILLLLILLLGICTLTTSIIYIYQIIKLKKQAS